MGFCFEEGNSLLLIDTHRPHMLPLQVAGGKVE